MGLFQLGTGLARPLRVLRRRSDTVTDDGALRLPLVRSSEHVTQDLLADPSTNCRLQHSGVTGFPTGVVTVDHCEASLAEAQGLPGCQCVDPGHIEQGR